MDLWGFMCPEHTWVVQWPSRSPCGLVLVIDRVISLGQRCSVAERTHSDPDYTDKDSCSRKIIDQSLILEPTSHQTAALIAFSKNKNRCSTFRLYVKILKPVDQQVKWGNDKNRASAAYIQENCLYLKPLKTIKSNYFPMTLNIH